MFNGLNTVQLPEGIPGLVMDVCSVVGENVMNVTKRLARSLSGYKHLPPSPVTQSSIPRTYVIERENWLTLVVF